MKAKDFKVGDIIIYRESKDFELENALVLDTSENDNMILLLYQDGIVGWSGISEDFVVTSDILSSDRKYLMKKFFEYCSNIKKRKINE